MNKKHRIHARDARGGCRWQRRGAHAQALRPNILILLDTSGSMLYSQANDGSPPAAPATNQANGQTSRVYNMKNAIRAALAQVGTDEANFGLVRFPQLENARDHRLPGRALEQRHDGELQHQHDLHRRRRQRRLQDDDAELDDARDDLRHVVRQRRRADADGPGDEAPRPASRRWPPPTTIRPARTSPASTSGSTNRTAA